MANTTELKLTGKGVAPVRIKQLDKLCDAYITERDKRLVLTPKEVEAKRQLIDAMNANKDKLSLPDGSLTYRYDETIVTVKPGKATLKVEHIAIDEAE